MDLQANPANEILYINFNQDFTCFVCGTETGFRVYKTDPFQLTHRRDFEDGGGLGVITMLFRTNIVAFSGGGSRPRFQPHKVVLWDDIDSKVIATLGFRTAVKSVRLRKDLVVAVVINKVYVYGFKTLSILDTIETTANPKGLCCLTVAPEKAVLVCPGMQIGSVLVVYYARGFTERFTAPAQRERTTIIAAHTSAIAAMGLDYNGALLATASDKGTILRVYDAAAGNKIREFRRGADRAEIHSLTFSPHGDWLAVCSDKGTVHVFSACRTGSGERPLLAAGSDHDVGNAKHSLSRLSSVLPAYFSSEWSLAQFRVPDSRCIACFGQEPHSVVIVCASGAYYKARFDPHRGGEMVREEFERFDDASETAPGDAAPAVKASRGAPGTAREVGAEGSCSAEAASRQSESAAGSAS